MYRRSSGARKNFKYKLYQETPVSILYELCSADILRKFSETSYELTLMAAETRTETITLDPSPRDCVSRVSFSESSQTLLVSTWAGSVAIHDVQTGVLRTEARTLSSAVLDAAWVTESQAVVAASLTGKLLHASVGEAGFGEWTEVGSHDKPIRCVAHVPYQGGILASGAWDERIRLWDLRGKGRTADIDAGGKVYGIVRCGGQGLLFVNSKRRVRLIDVRKTSDFVYDVVPPTLAYQLRGLSANASGKQYAVGSTEGRVAVQWFDSGRESFSFKCHRSDGLAFPVNCISHNHKYGSFATGGGDGHISFWDGEARKRIAQYPRYPTSIASLDFDATSQRIAFAVSYTFEEGEKDHPPDEVHIRVLDDSQIATKSSKDADDV